MTTILPTRIMRKNNNFVLLVYLALVLLPFVVVVVVVVVLFVVLFGLVKGVTFELYLFFTKEDIDVVIEALKSDYLTQGPTINAFETKFAN